MTKSAVAIKYNFSEGTFHDTTLVDGFGLQLMRLSARLTSPLEYTGLSIAQRLLRSVLPSDRNVETELLPDTKFLFPYGDAYWAILLDNSSTYSPEMEKFLIALSDVDYSFIDCGANYGYMSVMMTSETFGRKPTIAIEADPGAHKILLSNAEANQQRFKTLNRAVFSVSGEMENMSDAKHEARSILDDDGQVIDGNVETVALDDLLDWVDAQKTEMVMLKLDVEGVEIDAMKGAKKLLERNLVVLFEDHASDLTHETSKYFFETLGMRVFHPEGGTCKEMKSLEDIAAVKTNPRIGYDFVATNSSQWLEKINAY